MGRIGSPESVALPNFAGRCASERHKSKTFAIPLSKSREKFYPWRIINPRTPFE
jgi:hypothetical protein